MVWFLFSVFECSVVMHLCLFFAEIHLFTVILTISSLHCNDRLYRLMKKDCCATSGLNGSLPGFNGHGWHTVLCKHAFPVWLVNRITCLLTNWLNDFLSIILVVQREFKLLSECLSHWLTNRLLLWMAHCLADWSAQTNVTPHQWCSEHM